MSSSTRSPLPMMKRPTRPLRPLGASARSPTTSSVSGGAPCAVSSRTAPSHRSSTSRLLWGSSRLTSWQTVTNGPFSSEREVSSSSLIRPPPGTCPCVRRRSEAAGRAGLLPGSHTRPRAVHAGHAGALRGPSYRPVEAWATIGTMTAQAVDQTILDIARAQVLDRGEALGHDQLVQVLQTTDDQLPDLLALAHDVRMKYNGPDIE